MESKHHSQLTNRAENRASGIVRAATTLLEQIEYRRCESGEDLEAIYGLRYTSFRHHGLLSAEQNVESMTDLLDDAPNCYKFGIFMDGKLISTIRLHHLTRDMPYAPTMSVFSDVLQPRLDRGETFIDPSRLASDPEFSKITRVLPYIAQRLAFVAAVHFQATGCISMIREEHTAFYARSFDSEPICPPRKYPPFTMPIFLYETPYAKSAQLSLERFPFFGSTSYERRMLFDEPRMGEPAPLTILPSARFLSRAA